MTVEARIGEPNQAAADRTTTARRKTNRQPRMSGVGPRVVPEPAERGEGRRPLVVGDRTVGPDDRLLVALAGQQDDVARPRPFEGGFDRCRAVGDHEQVTVAALA